MLSLIGAYFPQLVIVSMSLFAILLAGVSIEDNLSHRRRH
ncbi:hypothetical protein BH10PSE12_BH10PSE12_27640 [soil metagenome]